jgi:hypothetical protein
MYYPRNTLARHIPEAAEPAATELFVSLSEHSAPTSAGAAGGSARSARAGSRGV